MIAKWLLVIFLFDGSVQFQSTIEGNFDNCLDVQKGINTMSSIGPIDKQVHAFCFAANDAARADPRYMAQPAQ